MKFTEKDIARLASFPEQNPNPVIEVDCATGEINYMNPSARKLFPEISESGFGHSLFEEVRKRLPLKKDFQCEVTLDNFIFEQKV